VLYSRLLLGEQRVAQIVGNLPRLLTRWLACEQEAWHQAAPLHFRLTLSLWQRCVGKEVVRRHPHA
jgi:hypothetical protein